MLFSIIFLGFSFLACDNQRYFEENVVIKDNSWHFNDGKVFEVDINDSLKAHNFYINVRNTTDYEFANLYFFIRTEFPNGFVAQDTIECQLADYQGKWLGKGSGKLRYNSFILRKNIRFKQVGIYKFNLRHGMRSDTLKGIADIGIRIEIAK